MENSDICIMCHEPMGDEPMGEENYGSFSGNVEPYVRVKFYHLRCLPKLGSKRDFEICKLQKQVLEFHKLYDCPAASDPTLISSDRVSLRHKLIQEELDEYMAACESRDLVGVADALGDLLYVVYGTAIEHGINMQPVEDEIHRSNLSKLGADGKPLHAPNGKVMKGPGYTPPKITKEMMQYPRDISEILEEKK